jgi:hypothetical protein
MSHTDFLNKTVNQLIVWAFLLTFLVAAGTNAANAWPRGFFWAVFAIVIVTAEALGAVLAERFFAARRWYYGSAAVVLWVCAMTASLVQSFNSAAITQDGVAAARMAQHASHRTAGETRAAAGERLTEAKAKMEGLRKQVWAPMPQIDGVTIMTAAAAEEVAAKVRARPIFKTTNECAETTTKDRRIACDTYRQALAAKAEIEARGPLKSAFDKAEIEYRDAHEAYLKAGVAATSAPAVTSGTTPFVQFVGHLTGLDADAINLAAAGQMSITAQVFLTILGLFLFGAALRVDHSGGGSTTVHHPVSLKWTEFEDALRSLKAPA